MRLALNFTWMDSGKLFVLPFLLLAVTMFGLHRQQSATGWLGRSGLFVVGAFIWLTVGTISEFWGFPLGSYALTFEEEVRPVFMYGWLLQAIGTLLLSIAILPFSINLTRQRILSAWMVPVLLFGALSTVYLTPAFIAPAVVWILLGAALLRDRSRTASTAWSPRR